MKIMTVIADNIAVAALIYVVAIIYL